MIKSNCRFELSLTKPRQVIASALVITITSCLLFFLSVEGGIHRYLSGFSPRIQFSSTLPPEIEPPRDQIIIALKDTSRDGGLFSADTLKQTSIMERALSILSDPATSDQGWIFPEYLSPGNVDIVTSTELGRVVFSPLVPAPQPPAELLKKQVETSSSDPLIGGIIFSTDLKALAFHLPLKHSGLTVPVQENLDLSLKQEQIKAKTLHFGGQDFARESFFHDLYPNGLFYFAAAAILIGGALFLLTGSVAFSVVLLLPSCCITPLIAALQSILALPAGIFSFCIPILSASIALLFSLYFMETYTMLSQSIPEKSARLKKTINIVEPQLRLVALTLAAGLGTLLFSSSPPVRSFGLLAAGSLSACWLFTAFLLPSALMMLDKDATTRRFFSFPENTVPPRLKTSLTAALEKTGILGEEQVGRTLIVHSLIAAACLVPALLITIEDNPIDWFAPDHPVQEAEKVINKYFAGSYKLEVNLLTQQAKPQKVEEAAGWLKDQLRRPLAVLPDVRDTVYSEIELNASTSESSVQMAEALAISWQERLQTLPVEEALLFDLWSKAIDTLSQLLHQQQVFLHPEMMHYVEGLQRHLIKQPQAIKVISVVDIVKTMHRALFENSADRFTIPTTAAGVAQSLKAYRKQRHPQKLDHFINRDANRTTLHVWLQNNSNEDIDALRETVTDYLSRRPPPATLSQVWAGTVMEHKRWSQDIAETMILWGAAALLISSLFLAFLIKSALIGVICSGLTLYTLTLSFGISSLFGAELTPLNTSLFGIATIFSFTMALFHIGLVRLSIREPSLAKSIQAGGHLRFFSTEVLKKWLIVSIFSSLLFIFSPYELLKSLSLLITIINSSLVFALYTLFPRLVSILHDRLFSLDESTDVHPPADEKPHEEHTENGVAQTADDATGQNRGGFAGTAETSGVDQEGDQPFLDVQQRDSLGPSEPDDFEIDLEITEQKETKTGEELEESLEQKEKTDRQ